MATVRVCHLTINKENTPKFTEYKDSSYFIQMDGILRIEDDNNSVTVVYAPGRWLEIKVTEDQEDSDPGDED
jgi:hypothetical protein